MAKFKGRQSTNIEDRRLPNTRRYEDWNKPGFFDSSEFGLQDMRDFEDALNDKLKRQAIRRQNDQQEAQRADQKKRRRRTVAEGGD